MVRCPCVFCTNLRFSTIEDVRYYLYHNGFCESYLVWQFHGEVICSSSQNEVMDCDDVFDAFEMLRDGTGAGYYWNIENVSDRDARVEEPDYLASEFYNMVDDTAIPIYPDNTKFTKICFVTKLLHFKHKHGCSDKRFNELIKLISDVLPENHTLPKDYYEFKKMVRWLNLGYYKIDACENDCMLFYSDDINLKNCKYCHKSRYKDVVGEGSKTIPKKILRYFPITSRLRQLYMSSRTAKDMQWYKNREVIDGVLTHPADGEEWKQFDLNYPDVAQEVRNVRVGLATDGFSPYNNAYSTTYSVWPVIMVVDNLPPSMCMKDPYMFMTLLIPGEKSPTRGINVYLRPLIDELKVLWRDGVPTYDAYSKTNFTMRTTLLWTINDFPALDMVSGWSTHGKLACPVCIVISSKGCIQDSSQSPPYITI